MPSNLKRIVRKRMEKTGESYQQALRQVRAHLRSNGQTATVCVGRVRAPMEVDESGVAGSFRFALLVDATDIASKIARPPIEVGCILGRRPRSDDRNTRWRRPMSDAKSAQLRVDGVSLHYDTRGSGPVLVMLQGGDGDANGLVGLVEHLTTDFPVVTYVRRGIGRSKLDPGAAPAKCRDPRRGCPPPSRSGNARAGLRLRGRPSERSSGFSLSLALMPATTCSCPAHAPPATGAPTTGAASTVTGATAGSAAPARRVRGHIPREFAAIEGSTVPLILAFCRLDGRDHRWTHSYAGARCGPRGVNTGPSRPRSRPPRSGHGPAPRPTCCHKRPRDVQRGRGGAPRRANSGSGQAALRFRPARATHASE